MCCLSSGQDFVTQYRELLLGLPYCLFPYMFIVIHRLTQSAISIFVISYKPSQSTFNYKLRGSNSSIPELCSFHSFYVNENVSDHTHFSSVTLLHASFLSAKYHCYMTACTQRV